MKKLIIITLFMLVVLSGCSKNNKILVGDLMSEINYQQKPFISINTLTVYQTNGTYTVIISDDGTIRKKVEFSSDRKSRDVQGLSLLKTKNISQYLGKNINELETNLGEFHSDIGSGFYIPIYITEDGFAVCFHVENDIVFEVIKHDLLSNSVVERVYE